MECELMSELAACRATGAVWRRARALSQTLIRAMNGRLPARATLMRARAEISGQRRLARERHRVGMLGGSRARSLKGTPRTGRSVFRIALPNARRVG